MAATHRSGPIAAYSSSRRLIFDTEKECVIAEFSKHILVSALTQMVRKDVTSAMALQVCDIE